MPRVGSDAIQPVGDAPPCPAPDVVVFVEKLVRRGTARRGIVAMTCQKAAEVISRSADALLSTRERVGLGVHTLFCGPCRRFRQQLLRLHAACGQTLFED